MMGHHNKGDWMGLLTKKENFGFSTEDLFPKVDRNPGEGSSLETLTFSLHLIQAVNIIDLDFTSV